MPTTPYSAQWTIGAVGARTNVADWNINGVNAEPGADDAANIYEGTITYDTTDTIWSLLGGGTLDMTGGSLTIENASDDNAMNIGAGASLIIDSGASDGAINSTISGAVSGAGTFVLDGGDTIYAGAPAPREATSWPSVHFCWRAAAIRPTATANINGALT